MKKLIVLLVIAMLMTSCCKGQLISMLPDQIYYADDSCTYYLPDYSSAIVPTDNCDVTYFYQFPASGALLLVGDVTEVSVVAGDASGNEHTIRFNVMLVDTIPPSFMVDTLLFNSLAHYQNETRTFHLTNWIGANGDTLQSPSDFGFWGYYTAKDVANIDIAKGSFASNTFVPWYEVDKDHPLYWEGWPQLQEVWNGQDSTTAAQFQSSAYFKRSIFYAEHDYELAAIKVYVSKQGNPTDYIYVNIFEVDADDNPTGSSLSHGVYEASELTTENEWYLVTMQSVNIENGKKYVIDMGAPGTDSDNRVTWMCNATRNSPIRWLRYTYDNGETWGKNEAMCYMFEVYGKNPIFAKL